MTTPVEITTEIQKLAPSAVIELFILDATAIGGDLYRFHAGTNELKTDIVWDGETYTKYPVQVSGFEFGSSGQFPRPKLQVSNLLSAITTLVLSNNDLLGAKVTRKRTFKKYLDAVNFTGGVNADADPTVEFEQDIYFIDRKSSENRDMVEFELAASVDLVGVFIPRRQVIQNLCPWVYRGADCGYTGAPVWNINDEEITTPQTAEAQAVLDSWHDLQTATPILAAAETVLSAATQAMNAACEIMLLETQFERDSLDTADPARLVYGVVYDLNALYGITNPHFGGVTSAWWNTSLVTLGTEYRVGALVQHAQKRIESIDTGVFNFDGDLYKIERWGYDVGGCATATAAYTAALADRDAKKATYDAAVAAFDAATLALPVDDPIYSEERCGKRLTSCKLRFGENGQLSFGGFPASGLVR